MRCCEIQDWMISPIDQNKLNNWELPPSTAEPQVSQFPDWRIRRFLAHSSTTLFQDTHKPPNCLKRKHKNSPETRNEDNTYLSRFFRRRYQWGIPSFTTVISTRPIKQKREQNNLISAMPQSEAQNWREPRSTRKAYNTNWNRTSVTSLPCAKETNPTTIKPKSLLTNFFFPKPRPGMRHLEIISTQET